MFSDGFTAYEDFKSQGNLQSLEQAISKFETLTEMIPKNNPRLFQALNNLGTLLLCRFEELGRVADINKAIEQLGRALALETGTDPGLLINLGGALVRRFERLGNMDDIQAAITRQQEVVDLTPDDHPNKPMYLNNLGASFLARFRRLGNLDDIDAAIAQHQASINLTPDGHPEKVKYLTNLGNSLLIRHEHSGNQSDLDAAIIQQQAAVDATPDGRPDKPGRLNNLGTSMRTRFERIGNIDDIDAAITQQQAAVDLTPDGNPYKPKYLTNLGYSLQIRSRRVGNMGDIDASVIRHQAAVNLTPEGHPDKPIRLINLGSALRTRFQRLGNLGDINAAILQQQAAVNLTPDGHPSKPVYLTNLGTSLYARFERLVNKDDIDMAILQQQEAVNLTSDSHPNKPMYLNNLGASFLTRFHRLGNISSVDAAITQQEEAVKLSPDDHPNKPMYLTNLGTSLLTRFEHLGNIDDLEAATIQHQAALDLIPDGQFERPSYLNNLGNSYHFRFLRLHHLHDAETAISHFSASAQSPVGPPTTRFKGARKWIETASLIQHDSLLAAYECALELIPIVAWLGLPIKDRHEHLVRIGEVARDAAAAAISLEQYDKALEWLEQGRSIVWNQILQLRTPMDELRDVNPALADRLVQLSRSLDGGVEQEESRRSTEENAQRYRALTREWESIIEQVRSLPGFEDFLRPPKVSSLLNAAQNGPVIVLNITEKRCDALALVSGMEEVVHIPLPNITSQRVTELRDVLKDLLYSSGLRLRGDRAAQKWTDKGESNECKNILAELWNGLVKPVLDSLGFSVRTIPMYVSDTLINFSPGSSGDASTYLVVPNRATRFPPNTRSRDIQFEFCRFTC
jgi:tetratricopeptide (TPR) repeat protein